MKTFIEIKGLCENEVQKMFEKNMITKETLEEYFLKSSIYTRNLGIGSNLYSNLLESIK